MKNNNLVISLLIFILVIQLMQIFAPTPSDFKSTQQQNQKVDSLMREVKRSQRLVQELRVDLKMHDDTIRIFENQKTTYINRYFQNEKVYLTASDSINAILRQKNQREFERDYYKGRFNPTTSK